MTIRSLLEYVGVDLTGKTLTVAGREIEEVAVYENAGEEPNKFVEQENNSPMRQGFPEPVIGAHANYYPLDGGDYVPAIVTSVGEDSSVMLYVFMPPGRAVDEQVQRVETWINYSPNGDPGTWSYRR